jgi:hypothetical protein
LGRKRPKVEKHHQTEIIQPEEEDKRRTLHAHIDQQRKDVEIR